MNQKLLKFFLPKVVQNKASITYNKGQTFINAQNPKALEA
jgi:hypothetical protein